MKLGSKIFILNYVFERSLALQIKKAGPISSLAGSVLFFGWFFLSIPRILL